LQSRTAPSTRIGSRPLNVEEIVRELTEIRIEPSPLWRRDRGLNLFAGICKNPQAAGSGDFGE